MSWIFFYFSLRCFDRRDVNGAREKKGGGLREREECKNLSSFFFFYFVKFFCCCCSLSFSFASFFLRFFLWSFPFFSLFLLRLISQLHYTRLTWHSSSLFKRKKQILKTAPGRPSAGRDRKTAAASARGASGTPRRG